MPTLRVLIALAVLHSAAFAADLWVSRAGNDTASDCQTVTAPCRTVEHALAVAASGDTINVATGTYKVRLEFRNATDLTLLGGWDAAFVTRNPALTPTVLKARKVPVSSPFGTVKDKRVLVAIAETGETITLTVDGFVLTGGKARAVSPYLLGYPAPFPLQQDEAEASTLSP